MQEQPVEGMTVNERLYHFGLTEAFDKAALSRDLAALIDILVRAQLSTAQATETAQAIMANPKRYGF